MARIEDTRLNEIEALMERTSYHQLKDTVFTLIDAVREERRLTNSLEKLIWGFVETIIDEWLELAQRGALSEEAQDMAKRLSQLIVAKDSHAG